MHLQSILYLMQCTYWDFFSHCSNQFLNSSILMRFSAAIFCFTSPTSAKHFPLSTFFIWVNKKQSLRVISGEQSMWADALINHPSWNGQRHWKSLQKNSLKPTASHNNASWYTDTAGFLEHAPGREACTTRGLPSRRWLFLFRGGPSSFHLFGENVMKVYFFSEEKKHR